MLWTAYLRRRRRVMPSDSRHNGWASRSRDAWVILPSVQLHADVGRFSEHLATTGWPWSKNSNWHELMRRSGIVGA